MLHEGVSSAVDEAAADAEGVRGLRAIHADARFDRTRLFENDVDDLIGAVRVLWEKRRLFT